MKKIKKYVLLIMALNMMFFAYESEKREAEAMALSTAALILGGMAIVGGGAAILSRTGAGTLGEKITAGFEATGAKMSDFFSYNSVTDKGNLIVNAGLKVAMNNAIGQLKSEVSSAKAEYSGTTSTAKTSGYAALSSDITASKGDMLQISFDYSVVGNSADYYYGEVFAGYSYASAYSKLSSASSSTIKLRTSPSGHYSTTLAVTADITSKTIYAAGSMFTGAELTISNLNVVNVSKTETPAYQQYKQYESMPADSDARLSQIQNTLTQSEYAVSANNVQAGVSDISQLQASMTAIEDNTAGTNTLIDRMITALGNIPAAIKAETSDLWADAGAIWSGMGDSLTSIKTDVSTKVGALQDAMSGGIDNIRTDIGAMMDNLRLGIDSAATAAAANMAAWGQLTLDGIDAGIGTISTGLDNVWTGINTGIGTLSDGLTRVWERVGAIPAAIDKSSTDAIDAITGALVLSEPQKLENEQNMNNTRGLFLSKFDWITTPINDVKSLYSQRKSLYDVTFNLLGQTVHILPVEYSGVVSSFRPIMSGAAIMSTIIYIYRRVQPSEIV